MKKLTPAWFTFGVIVFCGCGANSHDDISTLTPQILAEPLLRDETKSLRLLIFGPRRHDGIVLPCTALTTLGGTYEPGDPNNDILNDIPLAYSASQNEYDIAKVSAGTDRVIYVELLDTANAVLGVGCKDRVEIKKGTTTLVTVPVVRLP